MIVPTKMKGLRVLLLAVVLGLGWVYFHHAAEPMWTEEGLTQRADLVVVARPKEVHQMPVAAGEPAISDPSGQLVETETTFHVEHVFKGDATVKDFVLHHWSLRPAENFIGPPFAAPLAYGFPPHGYREWRLFLVREADGRYAPVSGQKNAEWSVRAFDRRTRWFEIRFMTEDRPPARSEEDRKKVPFDPNYDLDIGTEQRIAITNNEIRVESAFAWAVQGGGRVDYDAPRVAAVAIALVRDLKAPATLPANPNRVLTVSYLEDGRRMEKQFSTRALPWRIHQILDLLGGPTRRVSPGTCLQFLPPESAGTELFTAR